MTEIGRFHIEAYSDRRTICGILVENGYLCSVEQMDDAVGRLISSWVVVYEKEEK